VLQLPTLTGCKKGDGDFTIETFADSDLKGDALADARSAVNYGLMSTNADGRFLADEPVSRAGFVALLVNAFSLESPYPRTPSYTDVTPGHPEYFAVETAGKYLADNPENPPAVFEPDTPLTHHLALVALVRITDPATSDIAGWAAKIGLDEKDKLVTEPDATLTRGEAARLFTAIISSRLEQAGDSFEVVGIK
jgi:hypothetical protein